MTQCPACQARFRVAAAHVGRSARCPSCKATFEVQPASEQQSTPPPEPTYIGTDCRLCGTRLYGTLRDVGKPITCPDCGTQTKLPPPKAKRGPNIPAAMKGEQYEIWEGDDQPWGSKLAAAQAAMIAVHCELCDTLQYVALEQVGSSVVCPDCGHATRVEEPKVESPADARNDPDYELEPPVVDEVQATPSAPPIYTRLQDFESKSAEEQEREISRVATNRQARPQMPRWPLLTGWVAFLFSPGVISRWFSLSVLLTLFIVLAVFAFSMLFAGYGALAGLPLLCGAASLCAMWYGAPAACAVTVVTESSEGNDQMMAWPSTNPADWLGEAFYLLIAMSAAAAPGYLVVQLSGGEPPVAILGMLASAWLLFPIMHLSTLEASSPFSFLTPGVAGSFGRWPGTWLLFYLLSALGVVAVGSIVWLFENIGSIGLLVAIAPIVGGLGAYFRLIGRLAWRIRDDSKPSRAGRLASAE